ncbi:MAG: MFS transporter, partial [Nitrososphaerota archaeon]|nr:MFS transporter [Nitrososphaerota archaeon]
MTQEKNSSLLRQRVFGGLWAGSVASSIGSSAGLLAITWFVYTSTGSAFDIALVGIAGLAPRILFGVA